MASKSVSSQSWCSELAKNDAVSQVKIAKNELDFAKVARNELDFAKNELNFARVA